MGEVHDPRSTRPADGRGHQTDDRRGDRCVDIDHIESLAKQERTELECTST